MAFGGRESFVVRGDTFTRGEDRLVKVVVLTCMGFVIAFHKVKLSPTPSQNDLFQLVENPKD